MATIPEMDIHIATETKTIRVATKALLFKPIKAGAPGVQIDFVAIRHEDYMILPENGESLPVRLYIYLDMVLVHRGKWYFAEILPNIGNMSPIPSPDTDILRFRTSYTDSFTNEDFVKLIKHIFPEQDIEEIRKIVNH